MAEQFEILTKKGHSFFLVSSAMQKCIRRNLEDQALYWMVELSTSGYDEYIWKRLKIIASEDVGLADNNAAILVQSLYQSFIQQAKKKDEKNAPERMFLTHAVIYLCRAPKSRLVDYALTASWNEHSSRAERIPDFAFDMHTKEGRAHGRDISYFYGHEAISISPVEMQPYEHQWQSRAAISHNIDQSPNTLF